MSSKGIDPGRILVDDICYPGMGLALTVEGYPLTGDNGNLETNQALCRLFEERIFTGEVFVTGDWPMSLAVPPPVLGGAVA